MDLRAYGRTDTLEVHLFAEPSPLADWPNGVQALLRAVEAHAGPLAPQQVKIAGTTARYSLDAAMSLIAKRRARPPVDVSLLRPDVEASLTLTLKVSPAKQGFTAWFVVPMPFFEAEATAVERSAALVSLVKAVAEVTRPLYGLAHGRADFALGTDPHRTNPLAPKRVYEMYWLNLYGPAMVEALGRQRVLATPVPRVETLDYGGVILVTGRTPAEFATDEARIVQARALAHLREDVSEENMLAELRSRSAKLRPVTRQWDPDIADLLELTLDAVRVQERQARAAELNRYRPPEVTEWVPLAELRPPDVDDVEATVQRYSGVLAEQLAALLHDEVPQVMQARPESLPPIDFHFWHFAYATQFKREDIEGHLVPAIGAYLGELLVRHLGGRWVPRRNLDESQVVVGTRAWLPFLRARHYMQSKQAALDCSLTQFFRVAQRHARAPA